MQRGELETGPGGPLPFSLLHGCQAPPGRYRHGCQPEGLKFPQLAESMLKLGVKKGGGVAQELKTAPVKAAYPLPSLTTSGPPEGQLPRLYGWLVTEKGQQRMTREAMKV